MPDNKVQIIVEWLDKTKDSFRSLGTSFSNLKNQAINIQNLFRAAVYSAPFIALTHAIKGAADTGEELLKVSRQIGITVEQLSGLKYAAELSETDIQTLTLSVGILSKAIAGISEETPDAAKTLKLLGINTKDANGNIRNTYSILLDIADRFSKMEDGAGKAASAMKIFGRGGKELIPLLNEGSPGIKRMHEEAERLGIVFSEDAAKAADQFSDNIKTLKANLNGLVYLIANDVIPALNDLFELMSAKGVASNELDNINLRIKHLKGLLEGDSAWKGIQKLLFPGGTEAINKELDDLEKKRLKILKEYFVHQTPGTLDKTKEPAPMAGMTDAEIKKLADAMAEWNAKIKALNPNLDDTTKAIDDLWNGAEKLRREFGDKAWISEGLQKGLKFLSDKAVKDEQDRLIEYYGKLAELAITFEIGVTEKKSSELQKRLDAEDKWAISMWDILADLQTKGLISQPEFETRFQEVLKFSGKEKLEIQKKYLRQIQDAETAHQLALIDLREKSFEISKGEANTERLALYDKELASLKQAYKETLGIAEKDLERLDILAKIDDVNGKIVDSLRLQKERSGSMIQGIKDGWRDFIDNLNTNWQDGFELIQTSLGSLQDTLSNISFDAMKGKFKDWHDYVNMLLDSIRKKLADILAQWLLFGEVGGPGGAKGAGGLMGLFSSLFGGLGNKVCALPGGTIAQYEVHQGGYIPRFHFGGLSSDEIPAILQKGEYVVSRRGVEALDRINRGETGGGSITVNVPITIDRDNKRMISELRSEIEETAIRVIRRHS